MCCDGAEGAEVSMLNTHSMVKVNQVFMITKSSEWHFVANMRG